LPFPPSVGKAVGSIVPAIIRARFDRKQSDVLGRALQSHPEGLFYLLYALTLAQQGRLVEAEEAFLKAEQTPSMVPVQRTSLFYAIHVEVALGNRLRGEPQQQMYRKARENIWKLVEKGNLQPYQSYWIARLATDANLPDLARWIIEEWERRQPRNLQALRLRLAVEFEAGAYRRVIQAADAILARREYDREAREYRESALILMHPWEE
jgi:hypothetical protein